MPGGMALTPRVASALAVLALRCSALQLAADPWRICQNDTIAYEAVQQFPAACSVFCIPPGECEEKAQTGKLGHFGITEQGNCQSKGYTAPMELGSVSQMMVGYLKTLEWPCQGMALAQKFVKPEVLRNPSKQVWRRGKPACKYEEVAFEALSPRSPGECTVICVPEGSCSTQAASGSLRYLGVTGVGDCKRKGYTNAAQLLKVDAPMQAQVSILQHGPCKGLTMTKFQKPPVEELPSKTGRHGTCGPSQTPFAAITRLTPSVCSLYCIPEGECLGQVQSGSMKNLGLIGEGNCYARGFTERMQYNATPWKGKVQGPCSGMGVTHFQRAALVPLAPQGLSTRGAPPGGQGQRLG